MVRVKAVKFRDVKVGPMTTITGGMLSQPMHLTTTPFHAGAGDGDFVLLKKGDRWLSSSACGPTNRQQGLQRTRMLETLITTAQAAVAAAAEAPELDGPPAGADPPAHDPMAAFEYEDEDTPPPALAGPDGPDTPPKKARRQKVVRRNAMVNLTMPAQCKEMHPDCDGTRKVTCYVKDSRHVYMSVDDVPWLVRYVHEQYVLGGIPLVEHPRSRVKEDDASAPAFAGQGGAAPISWDFTTDAWVARGRRLKAVDFSAGEAEGLGVDKAAWLLFGYPQKKAFAYKCMQHWLGQ
jgi:hypothetical protein